MNHAKQSFLPYEAPGRLLDVGTALLIAILFFWVILPIPLALMLWFR